MAKTKRVGLYFNLALVHHQGMASGIVKYARERNWDLFGAYWPMSAIADFGKWEGDGIIAAVETAEDIAMLTGSGVPVVDTSGAIFDSRLSLVTNDNVEIGRVGGGHILDTGIERFAFCGAEGSMWSEERLRGFTRAVGVDSSEKIALFKRPIAWWHKREHSRELAAFLAGCRKPTGLMAANDIIGMNVVAACRAAKLRIPDDVAIVSVDNEELLCELSKPPLSSIPFNRHEIGVRAAERLDVLMGQLLPTMPELRVSPMPLVERASSGVIAVSDPMVAEALSLIRSQAASNLSAGDVAARLFCSRRNLERRFKEQLGRTVLEEIHRTRINHAKRLLRGGDLSIKKVSSLSGFRTVDRFTAIFTRYASMTPTAYLNGYAVGRSPENDGSQN